MWRSYFQLQDVSVSTCYLYTYKPMCGYRTYAVAEPALLGPLSLGRQQLANGHYSPIVSRVPAAPEAVVELVECSCVSRASPCVIWSTFHVETCTFSLSRITMNTKIYTVDAKITCRFSHRRTIVQRCNRSYKTAIERHSAKRTTGIVRPYRFISERAK